MKESEKLRIKSFENLSKEINEILLKRKKKRISKSRLAPYIHEIIYLINVENANYTDVTLWLRKNKRIVISRQAVRNFYVKHTKELDKE
ncbi:hypothetical protein KUL42_39570 [Alteromonas sp. KUL42]|uniref:hypothetical protein n=1 Tax=Alteromonas sp. KUL42 TaxID=2480797 RepID=UPI0010359553|nr:hypothetical protein [Alteromonas sp. KUL42]TAP31759.1 hypothetical protein EYR97_19930 [Alteromonas sp. KUL42]GEA09196.1 hypothetical protein KUL42_39570 [Alteromonas sp. KUL42]